jgi:hypothetical protein
MSVNVGNKSNTTNTMSNSIILSTEQNVTVTAAVEQYIPGQKLSPEQVEAWAVKYETTGKLPSPKIPCSTGCGVETTMFGDNLHKRVAKFGGVRNLLNNFVCRSGRQLEKMQALVAKINAPKQD